MNNNQLHQLTYKSIANFDLDVNQLNTILEKANYNNAKVNVTGCLIYYNQNFVEILEGKKEDVELIYNKIILDKIHHSIEILWESTTEKRFFSEWNMGFYSPENKNETLFVNNYLMLSNISDKSSGSTLSFWAAVQKILMKTKL